MSTFTIARLTFFEAARRKIMLAALLLGVIFLIVYGIGFHYMILGVSPITRRSPLQQNEVANFLMLAGLYAVNFLTVMMTVLTSVDTISGEIASGTIHTLAAKPIRRWEVVAGKWLGFAGMLTIYLLIMAGGVILLVYLISGYAPPHPERALALMELNALLLLGVSLLGGTYLSTLANGVLVFGLYGIAFLGGWIEQIGTFLNNLTTSQTATNIGIITSLILPSEALWRRASYEVESPLVRLIGVTPFSSTSVPSLVMIAYAVLYAIVVFFLAVQHFSKRDL
jgi:ABC-type transport system involved in multi-copper enzyme maturation permease subunit